MVVTVFWMNSWAVVTISLSVLVTILMFLVFCTCCKFPVHPQPHHCYMLDENDVKKRSPYTPRVFYGTTTGSPNETYTIIEGNQKCCNETFTSEDLPISHKTQELPKSILKFTDKDEEMASCESVESRNSFFSIFPALARTASASGSYTSIKLDNDE